MPIQEINGNAIQVRHGQAAGHTKYLTYLKHGGKAKAQQKAKELLATLNDKYGPAPSRHDRRGLLMNNNRSRVSGLKFVLRKGKGSSDNVYTYLVGNYVDKNGRQHNFSYSVERWGVSGTIEKGRTKRIEAGYKMLSVRELAKKMSDHYRKVTGSTLK